jgi:hypothetical protein
MLRPFGTLTCPRCLTALEHEYDETSDWVVKDAAAEDQRWICPSCGYNRPVVYAIERDPKATPGGGRLAFLRRSANHP